MFKALTQKAPIYLQELVQIYEPARTLRSGNARLLVKPKVRTKTYGGRRFDRAAAVLCNELPNELRNSQTVNAFKKNLKTYLFRQAFIE